MNEKEKRRVYMQMVIAALRKLDAQQMEILWYFAKNLGRERKQKGRP